MKRDLHGANAIDPFPSEYATEAAKRKMEPDIKLYQFECGEVTYDAVKLADIVGEVEAWIQDAVDGDRVQRLHHLPEEQHTAEFVLKVCRCSIIQHHHRLGVTMVKASQLCWLLPPIFSKATQLRARSSSGWYAVRPRRHSC